MFGDRFLWKHFVSYLVLKGIGFDFNVILLIFLFFCKNNCFPSNNRFDLMETNGSKISYNNIMDTYITIGIHIDIKLCLCVCIHFTCFFNFEQHRNANDFDKDENVLLFLMHANFVHLFLKQCFSENTRNFL